VRNLSAPKRKFRPAYAARARFARCVSFRPSDLQLLRRVIGPKERDRCTHDNHTDSANAAFRQLKPRSGRYRDNLRPASRRGCELIRNRAARSSKFHTVRSPHFPGWPFSFQTTRPPHVHHAEVRPSRGEERIPCPPRTSGSKSKCVRVG